MKRMLQYVEEFCEEWHYRCLMPVEYEEIEVGETMYRKLACVCTKAKKNECTKEMECPHYLAAPEEVDISKTVPL